jgi:hypothetical protein
VLDSADAVSRIAEAMDQAWHELLAADWPQLRAICERDVVHRVQGRQPKGSRKPGLVASASAGRPAQLAGYGHCPDPKGC